MEYAYKLNNFISENKTLSIIVVVLLVAVFIIGTIRKIKAAIVSLVVITVLVVVALSTVYLARSSYNLRYDGQNISITSDGTHYEFEIEDISGLKLSDSTLKEDYLSLEIDFKDGSQTSVEFPDYLRDIIDKAIAKYQSK